MSPAGGIPEAALRIAERRIRQRLTAMDDAREALAHATRDAENISSPLGRTDGGSRGGRTSDRTAAAAMRIAGARERLENLEAWERVFVQLDRDFPPLSDVGRVRDLCMTDIRREGHAWAAPCMTLADLARVDGVDRQTIARRKRTLLERAAYYAAEAGLLREARP